MGKRTSSVNIPDTGSSKLKRTRVAESTRTPELVKVNLQVKLPCTCSNVIGTLLGVKKGSDVSLGCYECRNSAGDSHDNTKEENGSSVDVTELLTACGTELGGQKPFPLNSASINKVTPAKYPCDVCDKIFSKNSYLLLHSKTHKHIGNHPCSKCDRTFLSKFKLDRHLFEDHYKIEEENAKKIDPLACCHCHKTFSTKLEMILHKVECDLKKEAVKSFACKCGKTYMAERFLKNHILTCRLEFNKENQNKRLESPTRPPEDTWSPTEDTWCCDAPDCGKQYTKYMHFKNHLNSHTEYPFFCVQPGCKMIFTLKENLSEHALIEHGREPRFFTCRTCHDEFSVVDHLTAHIERDHDDDVEMDEEDTEDILGESFSNEEAPSSLNYPCKMADCKVSCGTQAELRRHYVLHNDTLTTCSKCNKKFGDREDLNEHSLNFHNIQLGKISCPFCEEEFALKKLLRVHLGTTHPKPWTCGMCRLQVPTVAVANSHRELHSPKPCDLCNSVFYSAPQLLKHMISHSVDVISCPVQKCHIFFGRMESFERHLLKHQKDKIFKCLQCEYQCYNMRQLECHLDSGHTQKPKPHEFTSDTNLTCPFPGCAKSFVQETWLVKHRKIIHSGWDSEDEGTKPTNMGPNCQEKKQSTDKNNQPGKTPLEIIHKKYGKIRVFSQESLEAFNKCRGYMVDINELDTERISHSTAYKENTTTDFSEVNEVVAIAKEIGPITEPKKCKLVDIECDTPDGSEKEIEFFNFRSPLEHLVSDNHINSDRSSIALGDQSDTSDDYLIEYIKDVSTKDEDSDTSIMDHIESSGAQIVTFVDCIDSGQQTSSADYIVVNTVYSQNPVNEGSLSHCSLSYEESTASETETPRLSTPSPSSRRPSAQSPSSRRPSAQSPGSHCSKEEVVQQEYHQLISRRVCPEIGDFLSLFGITSQHLLDLEVPQALKSEENSIAKGFVIDLLHLSTINQYPNTVLARYINELLPERFRPDPSELTEDGASRLVSNILKVRMQASRFRAKYQQFPRYLDRFLLEKFCPFT